MTLSNECYYRQCNQCVDMPNNECSCECHKYYNNKGAGKNK